MTREAQQADLEAMVKLAAKKRASYALYHPLFHRPADNAADKQRTFFRDLLSDPDFICLVHEDAGPADGFVIGHLVRSPAVYDPGGLTCVVDDFAVEDSDLWPIAGGSLVTELRRQAKLRGAVQLVAVVAPEDATKRSFLLASGLAIVSEWASGPI